MATSLDFSKLTHCVDTASYIVYKKFLHELTSNCSLSPIPLLSTLEEGIYCRSEHPLDLYTFFQSPIIQKIPYYTQQTLCVGIYKSTSEWCYFFYTPHNKELLNRILEYLKQYFPNVCYEWLSKNLFLPQNTCEISLLSCIPHPDTIYDDHLINSHHEFRMLIVFTPVPQITLMNDISQLQQLQQTMLPFKEFATVNTHTHTDTYSNSSNQGHSKNSTSNHSQNDSVGHTCTHHKGDSNNLSLNHKPPSPSPTTFTYSLTQNSHSTQVNNQNNNLTTSSSSQNSCNYGNNCSQTCTHTHTEQTTLRFFSIEASQTASDTGTLLDRYQTLQPLTNYNVTTYFIADIPIDSICLASTYGTLLNPSPSIAYPQFINTMDITHSEFNTLQQYLLQGQQPSFLSSTNFPNNFSSSSFASPSNLSPCLYCSHHQLPMFFKAISP